LIDSRSVETPAGLLGNTITSHAVTGVNEHFEFIKEKANVWAKTVKTVMKSTFVVIPLFFNGRRLPPL